MSYMNYEIYNQLYARYVGKRPIDKFISYAGDLQGKVVADLCGGEGRIAHKTSNLGAKKVYLVEECSNMLNDDLIDNTPCQIILSKTVRGFLLKAFLEKIDIVYCRQAINYWFNEDYVNRLAYHMNKGGVFIFNTFNSKPSKNIEDGIKNYTYKKRDYTEISWVDSNNMVHHVQYVDGLAPHVTSFRWISPDEFMDVLSKCFSVERKRDGRTDIYICKKEEL